MFLSEMDAATGLLKAEDVRTKGSDLKARYNDAAPFPHIVIDDFLPEPIIDLCIAEMARGRQGDQMEFNRAQERGKREYKPDQMGEAARNLFYTFNSRPFLSVIENITGIKGLIPDPYFLGGGMHEIDTGGHLSVHADFNHHRLMDVERRINVLIYLNKGWEDAHGGQLELWDEGMTKRGASIVPIANRCVIFNTTSDSYHGNPNAVSHPEGISRKSIALYYYTATWDDSKRCHTTHFQTRPGSGDKADYRVKVWEALEDLAPPLAFRRIRKMVRSMRSGRQADA